MHVSREDVRDCKVGTQGLVGWSGVQPEIKPSRWAMEERIASKVGCLPASSFRIIAALWNAVKHVTAMTKAA